MGLARDAKNGLVSTKEGFLDVVWSVLAYFFPAPASFAIIFWFPGRIGCSAESSSKPFFSILILQPVHNLALFVLAFCSLLNVCWCSNLYSPEM